MGGYSDDCQAFECILAWTPPRMRVGVYACAHCRVVVVWWFCGGVVACVPGADCVG